LSKRQTTNIQTAAKLHAIQSRHENSRRIWMALDKSEVEKIAHLARLHVSDTDAEEVTTRITDILALIDQMQSVDTESVEPLAHPLDVVQRLRIDEVTEENQRESLQKLAPASEDGLYLVPKVLE